MKKILLAITITLATPAFAANPAPMLEFCPKIAGLARVTMEARQAGVPMQKMMEIATYQTLVDMITGAYGHSVYSTPKVREKAIQDFEDLWYLKCVKSYNL